MQNSQSALRLSLLLGLALFALAALDVQSARAQSAQAGTPSDFAPLPKPVITITAPTPNTAAPAAPATPATSAANAPAAKPGPQAAVPLPTPKPDLANAHALPTTNVVAGANNGGGRMLNPYSEQAETKYIKIPVSSTGCNAARAPGKPYFVEFRARSALSFGHTFVLFGKLGEGNRFASYKIAGLHPKGGSDNYTMGLWVPVTAETGPSDGDVDEQFMTARYCVTLTEAEYNRLVPYIKQLQSEHKTWHGTTYNCNSFGMDVAKFIGLDTPNPNASLPKDLIEKLAEMNKNRPRHMSALPGEPGNSLFRR